MVNMLKILVAVVVVLIIVGIGMLGKKILQALIFRTAKTSNEGFWMECLTGLLVIVVAVVNYVKKDPNANAIMWIGVLIFFIGGTIQLIARKQLYDDKTFEERLHSGFALAQTGLYSKIRHPSKTALLLMMIGFCIALGSWWALGLLVILFFPSMLYKISQEERELLDQFGERWLTYASDSKRIIPGIL